VIAPGTSLPLAKFDDRSPPFFRRLACSSLNPLALRAFWSWSADPLRSNLLASSITTDSPFPAERHSSGRPWWSYAAFAAFGLAGLEWVTWRRRLTV
jgi:hypothetical protein